MIYIFDNCMDGDDRAVYFVEEPISFLTWWKTVFSPWQEALWKADHSNNRLFLTASASTLEVLDPELVKLERFNTVASRMVFADTSGRSKPPEWAGGAEVYP